MLQINKGVKTLNNKQFNFLKGRNPIKSLLPFFIVFLLSRLVIYIYFVSNTAYCSSPEDMFVQRFTESKLCHEGHPIGLKHDIQLFQVVNRSIKYKICYLNVIEANVMKSKPQVSANFIHNFLQTNNIFRNHLIRRLREAQENQNMLKDRLKYSN